MGWSSSGAAGQIPTSSMPDGRLIRCHRPDGSVFGGRSDGCTIGRQPNTASGERMCAESVAIATDPRNLIRLVPAKEAGPRLV